jgi:nucleoside-diphosphate-sugar epimerase
VTCHATGRTRSRGPLRDVGREREAEFREPIHSKASGRILVTGANGFLGRSVATALERAGHDILRGARRLPAARGGQAWAGYGDVGPDTRWAQSLAAVDTVVHLAGLAHLPDAAANVAAAIFAQVNADGTARLAKAAAAAGVRRMVLISSALVHGEASPGRAFVESDEPNPASAYARSKLDAERHLVAAAQGSGLQWVILRPPMVYGAGAGGNFRRLVALVRSGLPLPFGAATAARTFVAIDNLSDAVVRCVERAEASGKIFLLGDAETTSTADLIQRIAATLGRRVLMPAVPLAALRAVFTVLGRGRDYRRLFDPLEFDTSRIRTILDWEPPVSMEEGLRRALR